MADWRIRAYGALVALSMIACGRGACGGEARWCDNAGLGAETLSTLDWASIGCSSGTVDDDMCTVTCCRIDPNKPPPKLIGLQVVDDGGTLNLVTARLEHMTSTTATFAVDRDGRCAPDASHTTSVDPMPAKKSNPPRALFACTGLKWPHC